jgi:hypothetical protein
MKLILTAVALALLTTTAFARDTTVRGYTRSDGTYVAPHHRSSPNSSRMDNYGTQGNTNPYTGQSGTVNPYATPTPAPNPFSVPTPNPYSLGR